MSTVLETHGLRCPKCGSDRGIRININVWATLLPEGSEAEGDHEWNDDSMAYCSVCDFGAESCGKVTVFDFTPEEKIDTETFWRCATCLRIQNIDRPSSELNQWWVCEECATKERDVCLAGNPAIGGCCGDPDCVCSGKRPEGGNDD